MFALSDQSTRWFVVLGVFVSNANDPKCTRTANLGADSPSFVLNVHLEALADAALVVLNNLSLVELAGRLVLRRPDANSRLFTTSSLCSSFF